MAPTPDVELREAFDRHGESAGRRWKAKVSAMLSPDGTTLQKIRVELTCGDASALAALIRAGTGPPGGVTDTYLDTAAVARRIHVSQSTIRSWLTRHGPKQNPFPRPEQLLGRNRWPKAAIDAWNAKQI
jgi:predicted DNA-binding transcriptional regulator AlpA